MAVTQPPYDPYIPSEPAAGGAGAQPAAGNQRTAALQAVSYFPVFHDDPGADGAFCLSWTMHSRRSWTIPIPPHANNDTNGSNPYCDEIKNLSPELVQKSSVHCFLDGF